MGTCYTRLWPTLAIDGARSRRVEKHCPRMGWWQPRQERPTPSRLDVARSFSTSPLSSSSDLLCGLKRRSCRIVRVDLGRYVRLLVAVLCLGLGLAFHVAEPATRIGNTVVLLLCSPGRFVLLWCATLVGAFFLLWVRSGSEGSELRVTDAIPRVRREQKLDRVVTGFPKMSAPRWAADVDEYIELAELARGSESSRIPDDVFEEYTIACVQGARGRRPRLEEDLLARVLSCRPWRVASAADRASHRSFRPTADDNQ